MEKNAKFDFIAKKIKAEMRKLQVPGAAIGIYHQGETYTAGFGITNVDNPLSVTPQTLFPIGSISKTFTAMLAMCLVEKGQLDLDIPIKKYLPHFQMKDLDTKNKVTMRHLLTHTGGWSGDYFAEKGDGDDALAKVVADVANLPQQFPMGEMFSYNNSGFYIAGRVLEHICGQPFESAMREFIFDPIDIQQAYYFVRDFCSKRFTVGHFNPPDAPPETMSRYGCGRMANPAGGIVTNVEELLRYARVYLQKGKNEHNKRIFSNASIQQMQTSQVSIYRYQQHQQAVAISWFQDEIEGVKIYSHSGGVFGQCSFLAFAPEHDFAVAILTNACMGGKLLHLLIPHVYLQYLDVTNDPPSVKKWPDNVLQKYVGTYAGNAGEKIIIKKEGNNLSYQLLLSQELSRQLKLPPNQSQDPPSISIGLASKHIWTVTGNDFPGLRGEFILDEHENVSWIRAGRVAKKID